MLKFEQILGTILGFLKKNKKQKTTTFEQISLPVDV